MGMDVFTERGTSFNGFLKALEAMGGRIEYAPRPEETLLKHRDDEDDELRLRKLTFSILPVRQGKSQRMVVEEHLTGRIGEDDTTTHLIDIAVYEKDNRPDLEEMARRLGWYVS